MQVDENEDIPMQRQACLNFVANKPDWTFTKEFIEKGVSGFKVSAKNRDVMQELQTEALAGSFDVLLVFMFDRIGRRDDETPFVVEWFVNQGIEVWSVVEGEQRFDNHVDKLLNYIRYWQASGESIKTSIRSKTGMAQAVLDGHHKGGTPAYGYKFVNLGRQNKKGQPVKDMVIDDYEASVVKIIFHQYVHYGMGPVMLCDYLTKKGIRNQKGELFKTRTLSEMIRNPIYKGILRCGETTNQIEALRIISDELFERAIEIKKQRVLENGNKQKCSTGKANNTLLSGLIFCGTCGGRLNAKTSNRTHRRVDGTVRKWVATRYICYNKLIDKHRCNGKSSHTASAVDNVVLRIVEEMFSNMKDVNIKSISNSSTNKKTDLKKILDKANAELKIIENRLESLNYQFVKAISGEINLSVDTINDGIALVNRDKELVLTQISELENEIENSTDSTKEMKSKYEDIIRWSKIFTTSEIPIKRSIISNLIERIIVFDENNIEIEFKVGMEKYFELVGESVAS